MRRRSFRHVPDRYGLWDAVRLTPPVDAFGPLVNLGLLWMLGIPDDPIGAMTADPLVRAFVRRATRAELATFIAFLAALGDAEMIDRDAQTVTRARFHQLAGRWIPDEVADAMEEELFEPGTAALRRSGGG